uniref:Menorin-like domain-containing protein n=1 Tax=Timema monikensis TaxID=170555 RepID=A0A7R9HUI9_9NEOP|nr:unnamed protein product [Timema monikensis]
MKIASSEEMPSIQEFFPSIKNDLTKVTWAHYVDSNVALEVALKSKVMMIVSDVDAIFKPSLSRKNNKVFPIMKRSPGVRRGYTLQQFMKKVSDAKSVAVKLNFDRIIIFEESIKILKDMIGKIKFPLWLNADTDKMEDKDIDKFLSLCTHNFPKATISIGMLHKGQKIGSERGYNAKLVTQMKDTLTRNNVTQTVAFPVDAFLAAYSVDTLPALKDVQGITDSALYMYSLSLFNKDVYVVQAGPRTEGRCNPFYGSQCYKLSSPLPVRPVLPTQVPSLA